MKRALAILALAAAPILGGCPSYDRLEKISNQDGQVESDQYARYGHDQAEAIAIGREYGHFMTDESLEARRTAADSAIAFAKRLPGVADVHADTLGGWVTIEFKDGWRTHTTPVKDGKRGCDTPNLPAGTSCAQAAKS